MKTFARKNIILIIALFICAAFILTGCASISGIYKDGKPVSYDDIMYFKGQVAQIENYLYYGNGYTASDSDGFDYDAAAAKGYLARINLDEIKYDRTEDEDGNYDPSALGVEKVNDKLAGFENQYMFALGEYLYFTSANTHKTGSLENDYSQVSIFRMKFDGSKFDEIGTFRSDDNSIITAQKGSDGDFYYIIYAPTSSDDSPTYNLYSISIGKKIGKTVTLAEDVKSVAVCDENSTIRNVVYTVDSDRSEHETIAVKAVDFATGEVTAYGDNNDVAGSTTELLGRVGDIVVYSYSSPKIAEEVFYKDLTTGDKHFSGTNKFHPLAMHDIQAVGDGVMFIGDASGSLMYKSLDNVTQDAQRMLASSEFSDVLFADEDWIYYSNSTSISRINVVDKKIEQIVSMTSIISGQCGYADGYIYFYAQLEDDGKADSDENATSDTNYYLHRTDKNGTVQLLANVK